MVTSPERKSHLEFAKGPQIIVENSSKPLRTHFGKASFEIKKQPTEQSLIKTSGDT